MNIFILTPVETKFAKSIYKVDFRGGGDVFAPLRVISKKKYPALTRVKTLMEHLIPKMSPLASKLWI